MRPCGFRCLTDRCGQECPSKSLIATKILKLLRTNVNNIIRPNNQIESLTRSMREHLNRDELKYIICEEVTEQGDLGTAVVTISDVRKICFHTAWTNGNIQDAKVICAQAVLYRSTPQHPHLYYAVYDSRTHTGHFCLFDPKEQEYTDVAIYSLENERERMLAALETYVTSNTQVLTSVSDERS
jgi:hypothetical protein